MQKGYMTAKQQADLARLKARKGTQERKSKGITQATQWASITGQSQREAQREVTRLAHQQRAQEALDLEHLSREERQRVKELRAKMQAYDQLKGAARAHRLASRPVRSRSEI